MRRVFHSDNWEEISENGQVVLCGFYHRYWNPDKTHNQAFDMFSGRILDVKEKEERGKHTGVLSLQTSTKAMPQTTQRTHSR